MLRTVSMSIPSLSLLMSSPSSTSPDHSPFMNPNDHNNDHDSDNDNDNLNFNFNFRFNVPFNVDNNNVINVMKLSENEILSEIEMKCSLNQISILLTSDHRNQLIEIKQNMDKVIQKSLMELEIFDFGRCEINKKREIVTNSDHKTSASDENMNPMDLCRKIFGENMDSQYNYNLVPPSVVLKLKKEGINSIQNFGINTLTNRGHCHDNRSWADLDFAFSANPTTNDTGTLICTGKSNILEFHPQQRLKFRSIAAMSSSNDLFKEPMRKISPRFNLIGFDPESEIEWISASALYKLRCWFVNNISNPYPNRGEFSAFSNLNGMDVDIVIAWWEHIREYEWKPLLNGLVTEYCQNTSTRSTSL